MVVCSEFVLYYFAGFLLEENSIHESRDRYIYIDYVQCILHILQSLMKGKITLSYARILFLSKRGFPPQV